MASAAIKHNFLNSQGPPEWGLIVSGPFRLIKAQLFTPGVASDSGRNSIKSVVFVPGKDKGEVVK